MRIMIDIQVIAKNLLEDVQPELKDLSEISDYKTLYSWWSHSSVNSFMQVAVEHRITEVLRAVSDYSELREMLINAPSYPDSLVLLIKQRIVELIYAVDPENVPKWCHEFMQYKYDYYTFPLFVLAQRIIALE